MRTLELQQECSDAFMEGVCSRRRRRVVLHCIVLRFCPLPRTLPTRHYSGNILEFLIGSNVHDDRFQWIGIVASGLFWTCTLALAYHKIRKMTSRTE